MPTLPSPDLNPAPQAALSGEALTELMDKDPELWQLSDFEALITYFRQQRAKFAEAKSVQALGGKTARTANPLAKATAAQQTALAGLDVEIEL